MKRRLREEEREGEEKKVGFVERDRGENVLTHLRRREKGDPKKIAQPEEKKGSSRFRRRRPEELSSEF